MHQGCFVWTPTGPLSGWGTPHLSPARVCVRALPGQVGGPASRARGGAPHRGLCPSCPFPLFGPLRAGVARASGVFCFLFFFLVFLLSFPLPSRAPVVSGFLFFPAPGALGLGAPPSFPPPPFFILVSCVFCSLAPPPPPLFFPFFFLRPPPPFFCYFFFGFFSFLLAWCVLPPAPSPRSFVLLFSCPGPWRLVVPPPPISPPPIFFLSLFFLVPPFRASLVSAFLLFLALGALGLGALSLPSPPAVSLLPFFVVFFLPFCFLFSPRLFFRPPPPPLFPGSGRSRCSWPLDRLAEFLLPSVFAAVRMVRALRAGAAVCVVSCWCCPVASFALAGAVCCCLWLRGVRCWVWLSVVVFCWRAVALVVLPCCVLWFAVAPRSSVLCRVFRGSVLPCGRVLWCPAVRFALFCGRCGAVLLLGAVCGALCFCLGGVLCPRRVPPSVRFWVWLLACRVVLFALAGAVCCCLWLPAVCRWVWLPAVVFFWRVLPRFLLPGRVACCPAVCCGSLCCQFGLRCRSCLVLWCVTACCGASLGVLWCGGAA